MSGHPPHSRYCWRVASSPGERAKCYRLRAAEYARFYRNIPGHEFTDAFDEVAGPDGWPLSECLLVTEGREMLGTCRLSRVRHPQFPTLTAEADELMRFDWADVARLVEVSHHELVAGELGKFAITREADVRHAKWRALTATGVRALALGMHVVIALMPPLVERAARHAGVTFHPVPESGLRRDCPTRARYFLRYHDYFLPNLRKLGLDLDADRLETLSVETIESLLVGVPDGPRLWWITPRELAEASLATQTTAPGLW